MKDPTATKAARRLKLKLRRAWLRARRDNLRACLKRPPEPPAAEPEAPQKRYTPRLLANKTTIAADVAPEPAPPLALNLGDEEEAAHLEADEFISAPAEQPEGAIPFDDPQMSVEPIAAAPFIDEAPLLLEEDDAPFDPPDASDEVFGRPFERPEITADEEESLLRRNPNDASTPHAPPRANVLISAAEQPVPTISIHACWDRPEMAETLTALAADKRLSRASVTLERGGLDSALCRFAEGDAPDLLLIETTLSASEILASLDQLAALVARGAKIIVLGAVNDVGLLRELAGAGVSEYIVAPVTQDELARAICGLFADVDKSRVIAVVGARGGVGASTLAHSIAWSIAERQQSTVTLVDLDLPFGAAGFGHQMPDTRSIGDALFASETLDDGLFDQLGVKATPRLHILTAPAALGGDLEPVPEVMEIVLNRVRRTSAFVVLDVPHLWSAWVKQTLVNADEVLVVAAPDLASLRNTEHLLSLLKSERKQASPPLVALSMVGIAKRPEIALKDFAEATRAQPVASFPFDPALFGGATLKSQALGEAAPASKVAAAIDMLASDLTGRPVVDVKKSAAKPLPTPPITAPPVLELTTPLACVEEPAVQTPENPAAVAEPEMAPEIMPPSVAFAPEDDDRLALVEFPTRPEVQYEPEAAPLALAGVRRPRTSPAMKSSVTARC